MKRMPKGTRTLPTTMRDRIEWACRQVKDNLDTYLYDQARMPYGLTPDEAKLVYRTHECVCDYSRVDPELFDTLIAIMRVAYSPGTAVAIRQRTLTEWWNEEYIKEVLNGLGT